MKLAEQAKKLASYSVIDSKITPETQIIGIGSGSTITYAVERLGEIQQKSGINIKACIPSSFQSQQLILKHNLPLGNLNQYPEIDIAFDGADEVDSQLNCIKGGGGCHLQEKLVIANSKSFYIVADYRKESKVLGTNWLKGVPLEVVPMAYVSVLKKLEKLGGRGTLRMATEKAGPIVTDNGNFIIDCIFGEIPDPAKLDVELHTIVGIVETGLFCGMADGVYFGMEDGSVKTVFK